jgi:hypothetical protein
MRPRYDYLVAIPKRLVENYIPKACLLLTEQSLHTTKRTPYLVWFEEICGIAFEDDLTGIYLRRINHRPPSWSVWNPHSIHRSFSLPPNPLARPDFTYVLLDGVDNLRSTLWGNIES